MRVCPHARDSLLNPSNIMVVTLACRTISSVSDCTSNEKVGIQIPLDYHTSVQNRFFEHCARSISRCAIFLLFNANIRAWKDLGHARIARCNAIFISSHNTPCPWEQAFASYTDFMPEKRLPLPFMIFSKKVPFMDNVRGRPPARIQAIWRTKL